jgi:hypothetical protein
MEKKDSAEKAVRTSSRRAPMKVLKWVGVVVGVYAGFVVAFEALYLGWYQPKFERMGIPTLIITTTDDSGVSRARRLARFETDGKLYVSAHHWPRAWHGRAIENPNVRVEIDGAVADYVAVPVEGEEFERVAAEHPVPLPIRFLMGFPPPREILRLDPTT